jgi:CRP/FNR family transcriptional regulator, cyclic AMP receptor protein
LGYYIKGVFWDEVCLCNQEICHYKARAGLAILVLMLKQDYTHISIFEGFGQAELALIEPLLEVVSFHQDEIIFEQGQMAAHLFILLHGEVQVRFKPYDGPTLNVAHISAGGVFGWSSALRRSSYTSGAVALSNGEAARIRGDQLRHLCESHPDIAVVVLDRLACVIAERLRSTHAQVLSLLTEGMELNEDCRRRLVHYE